MRRKNFIVPALLAGAAIVSLALAAFSMRDNSLARVRRSGIIRIGYAVEVPYAFIAANGQVSGESPEVARVVISRLGIGKTVWRLADFGALLDELEAGRIDVIAAGMFITPERLARVDFTTPTFRVRHGLLVPKGNPRQLFSYRQAVELPEIKVAVIAGSVEQNQLLKLGLTEDRMVKVPDAMTGRLAVENGLAHALALSSPTVRWMASRKHQSPAELVDAVEIKEDAFSADPGRGGFAMRRADRRLLEAWNEELRRFIGTREHLELVADFGFTRQELPEDAPVQAHR